MVLFRLSFYYMTLLGTLITLTVGLFVSYFSKQNDKPVDKSLLSPIIHCLLKKEQKIEYYDVNTALSLVVDNGKENNVVN